MQGAFDTARLSSYVIPQPIYRKEILLGVVVYSDNPAATAIYNQSATGGAGLHPSVAAVAVLLRRLPGRWGGNIQFQGLGNIHVEGLTQTAAECLCWILP